MPGTLRFAEPEVTALDRASILGVRSGATHRHTGVWVVVVEARPVRSARLRAAVTAAYAGKYRTPASRKWVDGFAEAAREATTIELVPATERRRPSAAELGTATGGDRR